MSRSVTEERDRIQRQIEELEQNLGAAPADLDLLSSDTSSDDESDDEIQLAEPSHQVSSGLLAERDQIQQEIEELQTALQSQNAICLPNDDSNDSGESEGELDIPETEEGCLQVNLVYQQVLIDSLNQLEHLLNQNKRAQKELLFQMAGPTRDIRDTNRTPTSYQQPAKMYLGRFHKPYFKDKLTGLGPPANPETRDRSNRMTATLDDKRLQIKRWEGWQKTLLINAVSKDSLKRQIQPKLSKVDYLSQKMYSAREEEKEALREQIGQLEKDIQHLRTQKEEDLVGDRYDEHDWQKISNIDFEGLREADDLRRFWQNFLHPSVNKSSWTTEELEQLEELSKEHGERDWESIAEELGTGRTAFMCFQTYQRYVSKTLKKSIWSADEDVVLRELVDKMRIGNFIPYTQISYFIEGRDPGQLMYRWSQVLDPSLRKGHWSKEEDEALLRAVARLGDRNWSKIRLGVPGRSDSGCRDRYTDCLKEGIRRGAFDRQEIALLVKLVQKHGVGRWSRIAAEIPNRLDAQCLREWRKFVKLEAIKPANKHSPASQRAIKQEVEEEEELVESSEQEEEEEEDDDEQVVYMDSDDEKMQHVIEEERTLEREEEEHEQKKDLEEGEKEEEEPEVAPEEGPPGSIEGPDQKKQDALGTISYQVVERPSFGPVQHREQPVRFTLVDASGNLLDTLVGPQPRVLKRGTRHSPLAMLQVSCSELFNFLKKRSAFMQSLAPQKQPGSGRRCRLSVNDTSMDYRLMAAVTPWIGNLLVPDPSWDCETGAYALRRRTRAVPLGSTPFFRLFLQVLKVDALGCKDIIEKGQRKAQCPPLHLPCHKPRPNTVQGMLDQKHRKAQELKELQKFLPQLVQFPAPQPLLAQAQAPSSPQIQWMVIPQVTPQSPGMPLNLCPRSSPGAPSNLHPVMQPSVIPPQMAPLRFPHPTVFLPRPNLQPCPSFRQRSPGAVTLLPHISPARSPGNALVRIQARPSLSPSSAARPAGPAAPSKPGLASSAAPSPTRIGGVKRGRAKEPSPELSANQISAGESQEVKRVRRMTAKAKALEEVAQAKTEAKCKTSQKWTQQQIEQAVCLAFPDGFALTPGQTMFLMTPNGLVSVGGAPPPGLKIALPPRHQGPTPPMNVFLQPLAPRPPMLPNNTLHQASPTYRQQSTNSSPIAQPTVSIAIRPPSFPTIQPSSLSTILPPAVSTIPPPSVTTIPPPSVTTIPPPSVTTIPLPSVTNVLPPSVSTIPPPSVTTIPPPSVTTIPPPSVTTIPPPSVTTIPLPSVTNILPSSVSTIPPPSVTTIPPPSVTTIPLPSVTNILPSSVSTIPPPSVTTIPPPSVTTIPPPSVTTILTPSVTTIPSPSVTTIPLPSVTTIPPTYVSTIPLPSVTTIPPTYVSTIPLPSVPTTIRPPYVSTIPAPLSLHHQGLPLPPRPQWKQVPPRPALLSARPLPVSVPCNSAVRVARPLPVSVPYNSTVRAARPLPVSVPYNSAVRAPAPLRREALQFDPALMFCEPAEEVRRWLSGAGGVQARGLGVALPYLPPFVSSLDTLHALLASKERLSKNAFLLLPTETPNHIPDPVPDHEYSRSSRPVDPDSRPEATEEDNVAAVRKLVAKHCAGNPAYQMLKARFLSCFTVPALLATIKPIKEVEVLKTARKATEKAKLLQEGEGAPATHFTGITTHRPLETEDTIKDTIKDTSQDTSQDQDSSDDCSTNKQIPDTLTPGQAS